MFDSRISVFMGMFGSGKTEISLNVALELKEKFEHVALADIDVISSYFRSRDYISELERIGIRLIAPHGALMHADLPIITAAVKDVRTYFVLNPYRPFTDTIEKAVEHISRLSKVSRRKIDYLINNANLGNETTLENIRYGERFVSEVSKRINIPVLATVVADGICFNAEKFPVFKIKKFLKTPWDIR